MPEVVWFFDRLFLPHRLDFGEVAVVPLSVQVDAFDAAVAAYGALEGSKQEPVARLVTDIDVAAVVFRVMEAADPDEALEITVGEMNAIASAVGFRQMGRGRLLGALVQADGETALRRRPESYVRLMNLPFVPEEQEVAEILLAFIEHPQAFVFADLFAEACRDENPSAGVTRLWAVLEALAERLPGKKYDKVVAAVKQLGIDEPRFDGTGLLRQAYDVRNDFMHQGRPAPVDIARRLQDDLAHHVWFVLRRAGMAPVVPRAARARGDR